MKILQSSIFRAVCAVAIGVLLLQNPESTATGIMVAIGVLFLVSGIISCLAYWNEKRHEDEGIEVYDRDGRLLRGGRATFPVVGIGSILLGAMLALVPEMFLRWLMYALGAIIVLGAVNQLMSLLSARRHFDMPLAYWVLPVTLLLAGLFVLVHPIETAATPVIIVAVCLLVYGVSECINALKLNHEQHKCQQMSKQ